MTEYSQKYIPRKSSALLLACGIFIMLICSCTKNNGDIGFWFGQWKVESIYADSVQVSDYSGNLFISFQSSIVNETIVSALHDENRSYGHWQEGNDNTITLYFEDEAYPPIDGYLSKGANVLKYARPSSSTLTLTLDTEEHHIVFNLVKW